MLPLSSTNRFSLLNPPQAFWPSIEMLCGHQLDALDTLTAFAGVWQLHGCLAEGYNVVLPSQIVTIVLPSQIVTICGVFDVL